MKVFCDKGVAIHINPKPCVGPREGTNEASAGARTGRPLSLEKCGLVRKRRRCHDGGRQHDQARHRKCSVGSAWSENPACAHIPCSGTGIVCHDRGASFHEVDPCCTRDEGRTLGIGW